MNGAGNDFIILDGIKENIDPSLGGAYAAALCERHLSLGADGLMLVLPAETPEADYRMLFFNSDGSMGEMCGNGARCICRYGFESGLSGETQRVLTTAGLVTGRRIDRRNYRIRLNDPSVTVFSRPVRVDGTVFDCAYVELGNPGIPHCVLELPEKYRGAVSRLLHNGRETEKTESAFGRAAAAFQEDRILLGELRELGRELRYHPVFPKGANINFFALTGADRLDLITYERGVEDFTYACGTGTGSAVHVLAAEGLTGKQQVQVTSRGGLLTVDAAGEGLFLTGPTNIVAAGEILDEELKL